MKNIKVLGIDLAKNVFQLYGIDSKGKKVISKKVSRSKLIEFVATLPPCTIGIEACGGAHHWSRLFKQYGHEVKMMAPQFVKPYVMANKNDHNDARGISEAVTRPTMKFVATKTIEQQDILLLHRARELIVKQKTAQSNQIRGLLAEYGIVLPAGLSQIRKLPQILDENERKLTIKSKNIFLQLHEQFKALEAQLIFYNNQIEILISEDECCQKLLKIEGIGPITASAVMATIGDANIFKNGREVSAWLGLTPRQNSSGDKIRLQGISKRGDSYVRKLLIHGARSIVKNCEKKMDKRNQWVAEKKYRSGYNKAAVALANKNARIIWAIMKTGKCYYSPAIIH